MYAVIQNESGLPTVINKNDFQYPVFIMQNYEEVASGTKRECETIADEMLVELCSLID